MKIYERVKILREHLNMSRRDMERKTTIPDYTWLAVEAGRQKTNEDHLTAIEEIAPQYIYWVVTGKTLPACGQISPEIQQDNVEIVEVTERTGTDG